MLGHPIYPFLIIGARIWQSVCTRPRCELVEYFINVIKAFAKILAVQNKMLALLHYFLVGSTCVAKAYEKHWEGQREWGGERGRGAEPMAVSLELTSEEDADMQE